MIEQTAAPTLAAKMGHETILLVEDEEVIRLMLVEILRQQGYVVVEARRGANALALAEKAARPIDLLVTDMSMPGMTGWELAKSLRTTRPGLPVLFISGHNDHETISWGKLDPPPEYLFKPFTLEAFLGKARQMLDREKTSVREKRPDTTGADGPSAVS